MPVTRDWSEDMITMADEFTLKADCWRHYARLLEAGKLSAVQSTRVKALLRRAEALISAIVSFNNEHHDTLWEDE